MSSDGFSPKQLEQLGLVMDSKIKPIRSDIKEIKNSLDHLEQDVSQINQRLDKIESCPTIQKEMINK